MTPSLPQSRVDIHVAVAGLLTPTLTSTDGRVCCTDL